MFNWSWNLREQTGFISPKGPNFNLAPWINLYLDDTQIRLKVPRKHTTLPTDNITLSGALNIKDLPRRYIDDIPKPIFSSVVLSRDWKFYGDWFTGSMGGIYFSAAVISLAAPPEGLNLFHPRALESAIADNLTDDYGSSFWGTYNDIPEWTAPFNWRQAPNFPCAAARFEVVSGIPPHGPDYHLVMPLTKTHYLWISCSIGRAVVITDIKPTPTQDEWIDPIPFKTLAEQVLDSVQVTLSPQAIADQEDALRGLSPEERCLVKNYPPLKWVAPPRVDDGWADEHPDNVD